MIEIWRLQKSLTKNHIVFKLVSLFVLWHNSCSLKPVPRGPRILPPTGVIHLISRSNNKIHLCRDAVDLKELKARLMQFSSFWGVEIYHYSIMHTHLHLLASVKKTLLLPSFFKAFQISYFHYFKKKYEYNGHLWHGRYRSIFISKESHFLQAGRYIELNPVKAKMTTHPRNYPWTSYHFYAYGKVDPLVTSNPQYQEWGHSPHDRRRKYRHFIMSDTYFGDASLWDL